MRYVRTVGSAHTRRMTGSTGTPTRETLTTTPTTPKRVATAQTETVRETPSKAEHGRRRLYRRRLPWCGAERGCRG